MSRADIAFFERADHLQNHAARDRRDATVADGGLDPQASIGAIVHAGAWPEFGLDVSTHPLAVQVRHRYPLVGGIAACPHALALCVEGPLCFLERSEPGAALSYAIVEELDPVNGTVATNNKARYVWRGHREVGWVICSSLYRRPASRSNKIRFPQSRSFGSTRIAYD